MQIKIVCIGKMKETFMREAVDYYLNIIKQKYEIEIAEIPCRKTPDDLNSNEAQVINDNECERILSKIDKHAYVILLNADGKEIAANDLNNIIQEQKDKKIVFIIGGSLGVNFKVLSFAHMVISFSKLTFPHQLMRIFLLEQLSRY